MKLQWDEGYLLQSRELLQLPLVFENQGITSGSPLSQVFLPSNVSRRRVENAALTTHRTCNRIFSISQRWKRKKDRRTTNKNAAGARTKQRSQEAIFASKASFTWTTCVHRISHWQLVDAGHAVHLRALRDAADQRPTEPQSGGWGTNEKHSNFLLFWDDLENSADNLHYFCVRPIMCNGSFQICDNKKAMEAWKKFYVYNVVQINVAT